MIGIAEAEELPLNLVGRARASALAAVDRRHDCNSLIVADLSNDESYAEALLETFGPRVIGLHITRHGNGMNFEWRAVGHGAMLVYTIGRSYLIEQLQTELQSDQVRLANTPALRRAYEQLNSLETENRDTGRSTPARRGCTMIWHLLRNAGVGRSTSAFGKSLAKRLQNAQRPRRPRPDRFGWGAFT